MGIAPPRRIVTLDATASVVVVVAAVVVVVVVVVDDDDWRVTGGHSLPHLR